MVRPFIVLFTVVAIAFSALAQDSPQPARFFIERIEVRNTRRVSQDVVVSESLLREGTEYSETDLKDASARLSRLPFLLAADFALEKGSERGKYVLVINVVETKPFFFLIDARPTVIDDNRHDLGYDIDPTDESKDAALGFRWFVGGRGMLHVGLLARRDRESFTSEYSAPAIGYTQYNLFGTRAFATFNLKLPFDSPAEGRVSPELVAGIPLTTNQTLTFDYEDTFFRRDTVRVLGQTFHRQDSERVITLAWTYNTTNQPFVPTRGTVVRVAPLWASRDRSSFTFDRPVTNPPPAPVPSTFHRHGKALDVSGNKYWEITDRDSLSAGVAAGWADVRDRNHPSFLTADVHWRPAYELLRAGWSRDLHPGDAKPGDSRFEFDARVTRWERNAKEGEAAFGTTAEEVRRLQTNIGWVKRNAWGTLRLGVGWAWGY